MNPGKLGDTIAAISTPLGVGGIGIVRLSGPQVLTIAAQIFRRKGQPAPLLSHRFYLGEIIRPEDQTVLDEVLLVFMRQPKTYTREDVIEIQCHGGPWMLQKILRLVLEKGARLAEPGEFTKRAFLNGRIDLTQAEAVIDLIQSQSERSLELANRQRSGRLAGEIKRLREALLSLLTLLEASIDFPEDEIPELSLEEGLGRVEGLTHDLDNLLHTYEEGRLFREGIAVAIVGRPNVGKSSLLNTLLQEERAIVTAIPGTTRDVIEETVTIHGVSLRIMDTAGLRPAADVIEQEGVRRTRESLAAADLVLWVLDGSEPLHAEDWDILPQVLGKKAVVAINKNDLPQGLNSETLHSRIPEAPFIAISALRGSGIDVLKEAMRDVALDGRSDSGAEVILSNLRHKQAIEKARETLIRAAEAFRNRIPPECIALDLKLGLDALGEVIGDSPQEEILERIFNQFCIGK